MDETTRRMPAPGPAASPNASGLAAWGVSECGPIRQGNEDAFSIDLESQLFVVADGMGGHAAGEVASRLAIEAIGAFMERANGDQDLTWPFPLDPSISIEANRLSAALQVANRRVLRAAASHEDYHGMGT